MKSLTILKNLFLFNLTVFLTIGANSQTNQWAWIKGDSSIDQYSDYGTQGVSSAASKPGGRSGMAGWLDNSENLWLFGGTGFIPTANYGFLNDLWRYNPTTNEWTWMKGDNNAINQPSVYGVMGLSTPSNQPGSRGTPATWKDVSGNFWMFGGFGYATSGIGGYCSDLWKYNPISNEWIWMKGSNTINQNGVWGTQGVTTTTNKPPARTESVSLTDTDGNLWLFGGYGYSTSNEGRYNDLWKYNPQTNNWTWMKGDTIRAQFGIYGTKGVASATNKPGSRTLSVGWVDLSGNLWVFGGEGYANSPAPTGNPQWLNDLWKYNKTTNEWTWIKGDSTYNKYGIYGTKGIPSSTNKPGARRYSESWVDKSGNLWLFGGDGFLATTYGYTNELWKFNPITNEWTWISGDSTFNSSAIYGTIGVSDPSNKPGAREHLVSWRDSVNNFWIFGGKGINASQEGFLNDLWKYAPSVTLPIDLLTFRGILKGNYTRLNWITENEVNLNRFEVEKSTDGKNFFKVSEIKAANKRSYNFDNYIGDIKGSKVYYRLKLIDNDNKSMYSSIVSIKLPSIYFTLYPNPSVNTLQIKLNTTITDNGVIEIINEVGASVAKKVVNRESSIISFSTKELPAGIYVVKLIFNNEQVSQNFLKK